MSTICGLINSTSKLCRIDKRPAKWTFPTLSLEPIDRLVNLLATFRARHFQRQNFEKNGVVQKINKTCRVSKAEPDSRAHSVARKRTKRAPFSRPCARRGAV